MLRRSALNCSGLLRLSFEESSSTLRAVSAAILQPMIVEGWIFAISFSPSRKSSPQRTVTLVVPSPTSSSCTLAMSTRTLAAACRGRWTELWHRRLQRCRCLNQTARFCPFPLVPWWSLQGRWRWLPRRRRGGRFLLSLQCFRAQGWGSGKSSSFFKGLGKRCCD
eukprot:01784_3